MKLLIGLGNPDPKYYNNRHNVGFMLIDYIEDNSTDPKFLLKKSDRFMNVSGKFVVQTINYFKTPLNDVYIVHDDLDLPLGEYKIQFGVGPKLHGGINSIEEELDNPEFWRVRIGVDSRLPENRTPGEEYVLQDFNKEERDTLKIVFQKISKELEALA
jgi:PTH1 family peptidyl-tRNA hydrolase